MNFHYKRLLVPIRKKFYCKKSTFLFCVYKKPLMPILLKKQFLQFYLFIGIFYHWICGFLYSKIFTFSEKMVSQNFHQNKLYIFIITPFGFFHFLVFGRTFLLNIQRKRNSASHGFSRIVKINTHHLVK